MALNPQEMTGSRVRLRYSVDLHYDLAGPAEFLINVHAAQTPRQTVVEETFEVTPHRDVVIETDGTTWNRIAAFSADPGALSVHYQGLVDIAHRIVDPQDVIAEPPSALPVDSLR